MAGDGGKGVGGEAVAFCAVTPRGDQRVSGCVVLRRAGSQHDVFDFARVCPPSDLFFEFAEGVVDLVSAFRELADHLVADAVDLPAGLSARSPSHPEFVGELTAHLRSRERRGGLRVVIEGTGVECPVGAIRKTDGVGDHVVVVRERIERP